MLRGEAAIALGLAASGNAALEQHTQLVEVAEDPHPQARLRGILALGYLGTPGSELILGRYLEESDRDSAEAIVAAFALGQLPGSLAHGALDRYFRKISGGSYRQHAATLTAILLAVGRTAFEGRREVYAGLLRDPSLRDDGLRALALFALGIDPATIPLETIRTGLSAEPLECAVALRILGERPQIGDDEAWERVTWLARRHRDSGVRAAAIDTLVAGRKPEALDIGAAVLGTRDLDVAAAGVRAVLRLGGGALRDALAAEILAQPAHRRATLMRSWYGRNTVALADACRRDLESARASDELRLAAALRLADAGETGIAAALRDLFERGDLDATQLTEALHALRALEPDVAVGTVVSIYPETPRAVERFRPRLQALVRVGDPAASALLARALDDGRLDAVLKADLLRAWRTAAFRPRNEPMLAGAIPRVLAALVDVESRDDGHSGR